MELLHLLHRKMGMLYLPDCYLCLMSIIVQKIFYFQDIMMNMKV